MYQLIALTPLIQSAEHNLVRIERTNEIPDGVHLIASGPYKGIVINKLATHYEEYHTQYPCSFSVWISLDGGKTLKQEIRSFRFCFYPEVPLIERGASSNRFIRNLFEGNFPKDYANFFKLLLHLMQVDYPQLSAIDVEMKFAAEQEQMPMPSAKQIVNDGEIENVSSSHVQEALEHAYPNSILEDVLADNLRCSLDEVQAFLMKLESEGIVERVPMQPNEWIRKAYTLPQLHHGMSTKNPPKIAIITCLFPEKLCVDTIIENSSTEHRYSNSGDSNLYTEGEIAGHRIVATKLSMIGTDREAATSAGSITTRLLGKYQQVEHVIIVGVAGGQSHLTDPDMHIRLGDVVVSHGGVDDIAGLQIGSYVYAYNAHELEQSDDINFEVRNWSPNDNMLARTVRNADEVKFLNAWQANSNSLIARLNEKHKEDFSRPPPSSDVIIQLTPSGNVIVFPHPNASRLTPFYHLGPIGSMVSFYKKQDTNENSIIKSTPLKPTNRIEPGKDLESTNERNGVESIAIKQSATEIDDDTAKEKGLENNSHENANNDISNRKASTNIMEKNVRIDNERWREKFRLGYHLRAFDAGFDSVIAAIVGSRVDSWILVRGIADYQQGSSPQGKIWQNYAAANAVALVETILQNID